MKNDKAELDVTILLIVMFGAVFMLYIGAVAMGTFSKTVVPEDVYGNKTVYQGGVNMGSNDLNSSIVQIDNMAASGMTLAGYVPFILVGLMFLVIVGFKLKG